MKPTLRGLPTHPDHHKFDLPPLWDGIPIKWGEWERWWCTLDLHLKTKTKDICTYCMEEFAGLVCIGRSRIKSKPLSLYAYRCGTCGHDRVSNPFTEEVWDLDDSDYGDQGSVAR